jgi:hypothetical protein
MCELGRTVPIPREGRTTYVHRRNVQGPTNKYARESQTLTPYLTL